MTHEPEAKCDDPSTWNHKDEKIDLPRLLALIEAHGGPDGLDLHGSDLAFADLSRGAIARELRGRDPSGRPIWFAALTQGVRLSGAHLEEANLYRANLEGGELRGSHLRSACLVDAGIQDADLTDARLQLADLRSANLQGVKLFQAHLEGANLYRAQLEGANLTLAHLSGASFLGTELAKARLYGAELQDVDFRLARLAGVELGVAHLQGANFQGADLQGVDLYDVRSLADTRWRGAFLDRTRMRQKHLGKAIRDEADAHSKKTARAYHEASEAYLLLKNNFTSIGRYEGSAWAYVKEQQMEKMEHHWEWRAHGWQIWRAPGSLWRWLGKWGYELLTGYGERPLRPLLWAVGLVAVFFPLLYWAIGALPGHSRAFTSSSPSDIDWAGWGDSLIFSLTSFGTLSFTRLQPEGTLPNLIAAFEAMIGVLLFALFVFTLGNRISRS